jgi:hypothetical protein
MLTCRTVDNVDVVIWSVLETFMSVICASLMCLRPLVVKFMPAIFGSRGSENKSRNTQNPSWGNGMSFKMASKMRNSNGVELHSEDDEARVLPEKSKVIRVQKTWVTETSSAKTDKDSLELQERGLPGESRRHVAEVY